MRSYNINIYAHTHGCSLCRRRLAGSVERALRHCLLVDRVVPELLQHPFDIAEVTISPSFRRVKVYWHRVGDKEVDRRIDALLKDGSKRLRGAVALRVKMR